MSIKFKSTTILGVRIGKKIALGGDGQVTMGDIQMKSKAVKVRSFYNGQVLAGFAAAAADAMSLFEKFEGKLEEMNGICNVLLLIWLKIGERIKF